MLNFLNKHVNIFSQSINQDQLNILSATINDVGFMNFNYFKPIKKKDFKDSIGVYFVQSSFSTPNIKKLLNLKLLNIFAKIKAPVAVNTHPNRLILP